MWLPIIFILLMIVIIVVKNKNRILLKMVQKNPTAKLTLLSNILSGNSDKMYQELIQGLSESNSQFINTHEFKTPVLFEIYIFLVNQTVDIIKESGDKSFDSVNDFLIYKAEEIFNDDFENQNLNELALSRIEGYLKSNERIELLSEYISLELGKQQPDELQEDVKETEDSIVIKEVINNYCIHRVDIYLEGVKSIFNGNSEFSKLTVNEVVNYFKDAIEKKAESA